MRPSWRCVVTLLIAMALASSAGGCPRPCACPQPKEVHCTFRSLLNIPAGVPKHVERMNLGFNTINRITDSSFAGMRKLELLMIHGNNIHNIPDGAFRDLISIQMMKMSYNKLKVISRRTFQGLWNLARLHLDHNHLEFIHPDAFQGLTSLRLLQLEGNRLQQLHPATFATLFVLGHFHMSTLKHLYLSENGLTTLSQKMLEGMPHLENLFLHENPWTCDCRIKWFKEWSASSPGVLKCKKEKGSQLCPVCSSPKHLKKQDLQDLDNPTCSGAVISFPHRTSDLETDSELVTLEEFQQPLGNISLGLSDEHGNKVDLDCLVNEPTRSTTIKWDHINPYQIAVNITLTLDLECPIDRANYERLWRLIAYYSDVPAHLKREIMLSKEPRVSYRYQQDSERDALYFTGMKANIVAEPAWIMGSSLNLQLNRAQSTSKGVKLILSTYLNELIEAEAVRHQRKSWVMITSTNETRISQAAILGRPVQMQCNVHNSGNMSVKWMLPNGSKVNASYQSSDKRITVSPSGLLTITAVDHSDSGVYFCTALVMGDISVLPFRLTVVDSSTPPPEGDSVAEPVAGVAGGFVSLPCNASGSPDPEINWILPDSSIVNTLSNSSKMFVAPNGTLTIRHSQLSDNGYYKCVAGNQHGADSLAMKVTLMRASGGLHVRKYVSRPQPAEGISTKINAPLDIDMEASGDKENKDTEVKPPLQRLNTPVRSRISNVGVRGGHPSRKLRRRPAAPRRRIISPVNDRSNTVETRRRINMSNSQIDPKRWANILAKVRSSGSSPKTTTTPVQTSANRLHQPETASIKHLASLDRIEGSSSDGATTGAPLQETLYTVTASELPVQATEISPDIRPLDSNDQKHVIYQIAAPETIPDSELFTSTTHAMQTTVDPQSIHQLVVSSKTDLSTAASTTSYGLFSQESTSHTIAGIKVSDAIWRGGDNDDHNNVDDNYSLSKSSGHKEEVYQGEPDHNPVPTTAVAFKEGTAENYANAHTVTQNIQRGTEEKNYSLRIPLLTTASPVTKPKLENNTTSLNVRFPSRAKNSSNSRSKNGGRRKRPNRVRTRPNKSNKRITNVTLQPTSLPSISQVTKTTVSSASEIETSAGARSFGAKVDTTVPFTHGQTTSLSKMTQNKHTDRSHSGKNKPPHVFSPKKKVSAVKNTSSSHAKPPNILISPTLQSESPSTSLDFPGQEKSTIPTETISTLSPFIYNTLSTAVDREGFTSIHMPAVRPFDEPQRESNTAPPSSGPKSDTSPESRHIQPEVLPGAGPDKAENLYKPSEAENVRPSKEGMRDFPLRPFSSSTPTNQHEIIESRDSEIPSGSTKANIFEEVHGTPQVTMEGPVTSQSAPGSGLSAITKLSSTSAEKDHISEATHSPLNHEDETESVFLQENDISVTTITTSSTIRTITTTLKPPLTTTAKTMRPFEVYPHVSSRNISLYEGRTSITDSTNQIPDRHKERIITPEHRIIDKPAINIPLDRSSSPFLPSTEYIKPDTDAMSSTKTPKAQSTVKLFPTTIPKFPEAPPPRMILPVRPNSQGSTGSTIHHSASGEPQRTPVVAPRRGRPKIISTDISSVIALAESDAHLPCVATGEPSPFLSWTKVSTGASIAQNTRIQRFEVHPNGTLTIHKVLPLDRGQYLCTVQNQHGEDNRVFTLIVKAEHPRVHQPRHRDLTTYLGDTVELECRSQGYPPPKTTWVLPDRAVVHMDTTSAGAPEKRVSVLANGTLRIASATFTDRGVYKCIASNAAGADAVSVRLTVAALPPVIQQPKQENITLPEGASAYLNCSARGAPQPTISWTIPDGMQLQSSQFSTGRNLFVFPNGTLHIRRLGPADTGKYQCAATNTVGISSRALSLSVKKTIASARARITFSSPQKTDVVYGGNFQLDCVASGDPVPRVIWRTPSKKLVDAHYSYDPRIKVFANGSLSIRSVTEKDEGDYLCVARNKIGDDYVPLNVIILTKPAKIEQRTKSDTKVMYGGDLKVDCVASGLPNPKIQWALPDGTMINTVKSDNVGATRNRRYVVFDNGTLFFNDVGMHEEGDYTCYAENQIGKDEMRVHVKVVADVPVIRNKTFEVVRVMYGESVSMKCSAKGEPNPLILWFSPTNRAIPSASDKYLIHNDGTLVVQNVQRFDGGNYTCLARNSAGQDRKVTRLEILVLPPVINGLRGSTNSLKVAGVRGQRKLIHCEAKGTPVPRVLWAIPENVVLPAPFYGSQMTVHRNGTLDIHSLRVTDAAQLTCVARNEGGEAKLVVQLDVTHVTEKPRLWSAKSETLPLTVGRTMTVNCSVEGTPAPQVSWVLPSGVSLMSGLQLTKFFHKIDGTLVISNPALSEAGTYRCLARNAGGLVERTVVLTPGRKPEINNRYNSPVSVINGESLQLHCLSTNDPVRLTWTLPSGVVLNQPQRAGRYSVLPNGTLSIQQASVYDRGSYTCSASNEYGSSLLTIQVIIIAYPPRITSGPAPTTFARQGVAIQLNCVATGVPKAEVAWETPDRTRLIVSPQPRLFGNKYLHPQGSLIIQNPMLRDRGFYRCTAKNVIGVDSKGTYLHVY